MRLQLIAAASAALVTALAGGAGPARADGTVSLRGVYYKERATRVMQPMLDAAFEAGSHGLVTTHFLVDAITSASQSSGAVDAEPFTENRYEVGGGYTHELPHLPIGLVRLGATARYSTEPDYESYYAGARAELELAQKNTVLGIGGGIGGDTISGGPASGLGQLMLLCKPGALETPECDMSTYAVYASASQIVSRTAVVGASLDYTAQRGFLSNPYRSAIVGTATSVGTLRERHPNERDRIALAVFGRLYVRQTDTTLIGNYRLYDDDWDVRAHTPELRAVQQIGRGTEASLRYRYHRQTKAAFFYAERYEMEQAYLTDDIKLSRFTTHTVEGKLGILGEVLGLPERWAGARIEAILSYVVQNNRFGNAVVAHAALTLPFVY